MLYETRVSYFEKLRGLDLTIGHRPEAPASLEDALGRAIADDLAGLGHEVVLGVHEVHDLERGRNVDGRAARVAPLGEACGDAFLVGEVYLPSAKWQPYLDQFDAVFAFDDAPDGAALDRALGTAARPERSRWRSSPGSWTDRASTNSKSATVRRW